MASRNATEPPALWIIAGPNGSGKSSAYGMASVDEPMGSIWIINPDLLTARIRDQEGLEYFEDGAFNWKKGERVRVIDGRFKGLEGEIKRINGDHRLIVSIDGVCAVATTYIPRCFLEKI